MRGRIVRRLAGVCSFRIWADILSKWCCQSRASKDPLQYASLDQNYAGGLYEEAQVSSNRSPFRRFPLHSPIILLMLSEETLNPSEAEALKRIEPVSSLLIPGIRISKQRLLMGVIILPVELQHRMRRKLDEYFSMVLRSACWASLDNRSASRMTATRFVN